MSFMVKTPKLSAPSAAQQQVASYREAEPVPLGYGRTLLPAHWLSDAFNWREAAAGKNEPSYQYASIAYALGAGPIDWVGIRKQDGKLGWAFNYTFAPGEDYHDFTFNASMAGGYAWTIRIYRGTETQTPDSYLVSGTGQNHPAYRGLAYAVEHNINLGKGVTAMPTFAIECGRNTPVLGSDFGAGSDYGVNPFAAVYALLREDRAGDCDAALLDATYWGTQCNALWTTGLYARTGQQVFINPWFTQGTNLADAISQILSYCDGYLYAENGQMKVGWFPGGLPSGSLPEIAEADLEAKPSGGGFPDWNMAATSVAVVFTDAFGRAYEDGSAIYQAPANRETGTAASPQRKDRPFIHFPNQAQAIASEAAAGAVDDTGVNLQVLKSRAIRLDGTPLAPGDLLNWDYGPHSLDLICRVVSRRIRAGSASDMLEVIRERGSFPQPYVPAANSRLPYVLVAPANVANYRLWLLPAGFGGNRQTTCLVDRPAAQNIATILHLSAAGTAPWEDVLNVSSFAAKGTISAGGLSSGATTVRIATSSLDFTRMQAQSALSQRDDTLLLLLDDEVLSVSTITVVSAGVYDLGVLRGRQGTLDVSHSGSIVSWLFYRSEVDTVTHAEFYNVQSTPGVYDGTLATKHFKLQAVSADSVGTPLPGDPGISFAFPDLIAADPNTRFDFRFQRSATAPATPTGENPSGWYDAAPAGTDPVYMVRGIRSVSTGLLLVTWSTPVKWSGDPGAPGAPGGDGNDGVDAKLVVITSDTQTVQYLKTAPTTPVPATVNFTATGQNLTGSPVFTVTSGTATLTGTGTTRAMAVSSMTTDAVTVRVVWDGQTDYISVVKVREGGDGLTGGNFTPILTGVTDLGGGNFKKTAGTNGAYDAEVRSVEGYVGGAYCSFTPNATNLDFFIGLSTAPATSASYTTMGYSWQCYSNGQAYVYQGSTNILGGEAFTTADVFSITFDGTTVRWFKNGILKQSVVIAITGALYLDSSFSNTNAQANSVKFGPQGAASISYWITALAGMKISQAGVFTPASLPVAALFAAGNTAPAAYAGRFIIADSPDGSTWTDRYTSSGNESSTTFSPSSTSVRAIRVRLYLAGGTTTLVDEQTVSVAADGATGGTGPTGPPGSAGGTILAQSTPNGGSTAGASTAYQALSGNIQTPSFTCDGNPRLITLGGASIANAGGPSASTCVVGIFRDGSTLVGELAYGTGLLLASGETANAGFSCTDTPSAGSHYYQAKFKSSAGYSTAGGGTLIVT